MPLYNFKCNNCGHVQEELLKRYDSTKIIFCDECGDADMSKMLSYPSHIDFGPSSTFLGGNVTKFDTLNGRLKSSEQKKIYNTYRRTTPE